MSTSDLEILKKNHELIIEQSYTSLLKRSAVLCFPSSHFFPFSLGLAISFYFPKQRVISVFPSHSIFHGHREFIASLTLILSTVFLVYITFFWEGESKNLK